MRKCLLDAWICRVHLKALGELGAGCHAFQTHMKHLQMLVSCEYLRVGGSYLAPGQHPQTFLRKSGPGVWSARSRIHHNSGLHLAVDGFQTCLQTTELPR